MRNFRLLHAGLDVAPILAELQAVLDWGLYPERKERDGTAHGDLTADLWIRYFHRDTLIEPDDYNRPGQCVFYPVWDKLPSLHPVVWTLMASQRSVELGGILCTRLPPGGRIQRHSDGCSWHAQRYNFKCYIVLEANARCVVECDGEEQVFREGEIFEFDNTRPHSMTNDGTTQRTTMIVCLRCET
jgi:mannose-6-phosphate isomerase-like protein (cupin superfamily)